MTTALDAFSAHIAELNDLLNSISILKWDGRTMMPPGGAATRGAQLATLSRLAQEHFISSETARLLDGADSACCRRRAARQTAPDFSKDWPRRKGLASASSALAGSFSPAAMMCPAW